MQKKFLIFTFLVLVLLLVHTFVSADNTNLGDELKGSMNKAGGAVENVKDAVVDTANNMTKKIDNSNTMGRVNTNNGNGYTTVRTANTAFGMSQTTWVWLVLGVVGVIIILLSWYYMSEANSSNKHHEK